MLIERSRRSDLLNRVADKAYQSYGPGIIYAMANRPGDFDNGVNIATTNYPDAYRLFCEMYQFRGTKWYSGDQAPGPLKM